MLTFSLLLVSPLGFAQNKCSQIFSNKPVPVAAISANEFWAQDEVLFQTEKGQLKLFTFSFDSESSLAQTLKFLRKNFPHTLKKFEEIDGRNPINRAQLLRDLKMSDKQFRLFSLRKGIDKNQEKYLLSDLQPEIFESMIRTIASRRPEDGGDLYLMWYSEILSQALDQAYREMKSVLTSTPDGKRPETRYKSFEKSPARFLEEIKKQKLFFEKPFTHLHLGIPSEVSLKEVYRVGRAVEAKIILRLALENTMAHLVHNSYTSLVSEINPGVQRGVIALHPHGFVEPVMHDLEIREYFSLDDGLSDLQSAVTLSRNHRRLRDLPVLEKAPHDPYTSNLKGALFYIGHGFERLNPEISKKLLEFSNRLTMETMNHGVLREEISKYLGEHQIIEQLTPEFFLD